MHFEWDPAKARSNLAKHGLSFELAQRVWDDPLHVIAPDGVFDGEERWRAIGLIAGVTVVVVIHFYPDGEDDMRIRIISARKATPRERNRYEEETS